MKSFEIQSSGEKQISSHIELTKSTVHGASLDPFSHLLAEKKTYMPFFTENTNHTI